MNGDHLYYGEDMFTRNTVLLRPKTERDIYLNKYLSYIRETARRLLNFESQTGK